MDASEAVQKLRPASAAGGWLDLTDAADSDVPAEGLYTVLVGEGSPGPRALRLRGARIVGDLDLEAATLRCPLHLANCDLADAVTLSEATAPAIRLIRCRLGFLIALRDGVQRWADSGGLHPGEGGPGAVSAVHLRA